jgi:hypothetical protein
MPDSLSSQGKRYQTIVADPPWHYDRTGLTFHDPDSGDQSLGTASMQKSEYSEEAA